MNTETYNAVIAICSSIVTMLLVVRHFPRRTFRRGRRRVIDSDTEERLVQLIIETESRLLERIEAIEQKTDLEK